MKLKETTVYVPTRNKSDFGIIDPEFGVLNAYLRTGFFLTKESLIELLGSVWDGCNRFSIFDRDSAGNKIPNKQEFITSLFNTEEDVRLI